MPRAEVAVGISVHLPQSEDLPGKHRQSSLGRTGALSETGLGGGEGRLSSARRYRNHHRSALSSSEEVAAVIFPKHPVSFRRHSGVALALLTALNFFNYIDRYVLPSVQPLVQRELHRSDADMGWLTSVFFAFYMCVAPFMGVLADRYPRKVLIATGAVLWSGATLLTAVTTDYTSLLIRHTLVGIGEASFVTIAPAFISDLFPEHRRGRMLSIFYLAIPMGTAIGYVLGCHLVPLYGLP